MNYSIAIYFDKLKSFQIIFFDMQNRNLVEWIDKFIQQI